MRSSVINKDVVIAEYKPEKIMYDSPFPVGAAILDLAKLHLYHYYYDILKPAFIQIKLTLDDAYWFFDVQCKL